MKNKLTSTNEKVAYTPYMKFIKLQQIKLQRSSI